MIQDSWKWLVTREMPCGNFPLLPVLQIGNGSKNPAAATGHP